MHAARRQAHRVASAQGGDGAMNYNPFARQRSRDTKADEPSTIGGLDDTTEAMSLDLPDANTQAQSRPGSDWDWADRGASHVEFHKNDSLPFREVRELGHGVNGPVVEVEIKGYRVALKKIYCRQGVTQNQLQEIKILEKLKHPHIIEVVGSYTRGRYLGILLYPVATCDLSTFLEDIDWLKRVGGFRSSKPLSNFDHEEHYERTLRCAIVCGFDDLEYETRHTHPAVFVEAAITKLWKSYRCIASAIQHLHENSVRHKDLKPHNVLLSPLGLWVTDFGLSTDFSGISTSNTSGGDRGTVKYCAPEVAAFQSSGRSADIYSLGCVFFEMAAVSSYTLDEMKGFRPLMDSSFHHNTQGVASAYVTFSGTSLSHLPIGLARLMMSKDPKARPDIGTVMEDLDLIQIFSGIEPDSFPTPSCSFHAQAAVDPRPSSDATTVFITIGNTCQFQKAEPTSVNGQDVRRTPTVVFVDCSHEGLIDRVIFFQHCSSKTPIITARKHPFARSSSLWGLYTQAVLVVLRPGYSWTSPLASDLFLEGGTVAQSILPLTWDLQLEKMYDSKSMQCGVKTWTSA